MFVWVMVVLSRNVIGKSSKNGFKSASLAGWLHLARGHIIGTNFAICLFVKF